MATIQYGKAEPGVDYTLNGRIPSMESMQRFAYDDLVHCECSAEYGLTYQKCRFCDRGWPDLPYLLKYGVRHYVCEDCAEHFAQTAQPRTEAT
jgi:hypothetical protein